MLCNSPSEKWLRLVLFNKFHLHPRCSAASWLMLHSLELGPRDFHHVNFQPVTTWCSRCQLRKKRLYFFGNARARRFILVSIHSCWVDAGQKFQGPSSSECSINRQAAGQCGCSQNLLESTICSCFLCAEFLVSKNDMSDVFWWMEDENDPIELFWKHRVVSKQQSSYKRWVSTFSYNMGWKMPNLSFKPPDLECTQPVS